jgi:Co/Zn/Cd efflux system component
MNIDAAYLHVMGDMLMSVGVIIAALVIYFAP